jgi:hypothetical protein
VLLKHLVERRDPHEPVDEAARRVGLTELEADRRGDEVELGDGDDTSVDPADRHEDGCEDVQLLHTSSL